MKTGCSLSVKPRKQQGALRGYFFLDLFGTYPVVPREYDTWCYGLKICLKSFTVYIFKFLNFFTES